MQTGGFPVTCELFQTQEWPRLMLVIQSVLLLMNVLAHVLGRNYSTMLLGLITVAGAMLVFVFAMDVFPAWLSPEWYYGVVLIIGSLSMGTWVALRSAANERSVKARS